MRTRRLGDRNDVYDCFEEADNCRERAPAGRVERSIGSSVGVPKRLGGSVRTRFYRCRGRPSGGRPPREGRRSRERFPHHAPESTSVSCRS